MGGGVESRSYAALNRSRAVALLSIVVVIQAEA